MWMCEVHIKCMCVSVRFIGRRGGCSTFRLFFSMKVCMCACFCMTRGPTLGPTVKPVKGGRGEEGERVRDGMRGNEMGVGARLEWMRVCLEEEGGRSDEKERSFLCSNRGTEADKMKNMNRPRTVYYTEKPLGDDQTMTTTVSILEWIWFFYAKSHFHFSSKT